MSFLTLTPRYEFLSATLESSFWAYYYLFKYVSFINLNRIVHLGVNGEQHFLEDGKNVTNNKLS